MSIPTPQKLELYRFFAVAYNAAPGVEYLNQVDTAFNGGMSVAQIVEVFTTKHEFTDVYAESMAPADFATLLVNNVVKNSAGAEAKAEAVADIVEALAAGWSRGKVIYQIFSNLSDKDADDATWGDTSQQMENQVAVAQHFTEVQNVNTTDLTALRAVLLPVTETTDVSTTAKLEDFISTAVRGTSVNSTLTYSSNTFLESAANDGSISNTLTINLVGSETFVGENGASLQGAVVNNVPAGLTAVLIKTSDTTAQLSLTGHALSHANANDVFNLTVTFSDASYAGGKASFVTSTTKALNIDFFDPVSYAYVPPSFTVAETDGVVSFGGNAVGDITISITGGTGTFSREGITATTTVPAVQAKVITGSSDAGETWRLATTIGSGSVTFDGQGGNDKVILADGGNTVSLNLTSIESVDGGSGNDNLSVTSSTGVVIDGKAGNDVISGGAGADSIYGGAGNDVFVYAAVADLLTDATVSGGADSDTIQFTANATVVDSNFAHADTVETLLLSGAGAQSVTFDGTVAQTVGIRTITATASTVASTIDISGTTAGLTINAGSGADIITGGSGADTITGGAGADTISAGDGNDTLVYLLQADLYSGAALVDSITGGNGTDRLLVGTSGTTFTVGSGVSFARANTIEKIESVANTAAVSITLNADADTAGIRTVDLSAGSSATGNVIDVSSFTHDTTLTGSSTGATAMIGGAGADTITGGSAADTITGGAGIDSLVGGAGDDTYVYTSSAEFVTGTAVVDSINDTSGTADRALISGAISIANTMSLARAVGVDQVVAASDATARVHSIAISSDASLQDVRVINLSGSSNASSTGTVDLTGVTAGVAVTGVAAGNNTLTGGSGADTITGGSAADTITGGAGIDSLVGGAGDDTYVYTSSAEFVTGTAVVDSINDTSGTADRALISGAISIANTMSLARAVGVDQVVAASDATARVHSIAISSDASLQDVRVINLSGSSNASSTGTVDLTGVTAGVAVTGVAAGNNTLTGGSGADTITGGSAADTITGGLGADTISAGDGNDTLVYLLQADLYSGAALVDSITGGNGTDRLLVGTSGTTFTVGSGVSFARANTIEKIESVANTAAVSITLNADADTAGIRTVDLSAGSAAVGNVIDVSSFTHDTTLTGSSTGATAMTGGAGADTITGGSAADTITGGAGSDSIDAGSGNDVLVFASASELSGDATVVGNTGTDTIRMDTLTNALTLVSSDFAHVNSVETLALNGTGAQTVTLGTETNNAFSAGTITITTQATATSLNLDGSMSNHSLYVTGTNNADTIIGGTVADTLLGGSGNDIITGNGGADSLDGGAGNDTFRFASASELSTDATVIGGSETDTIVFTAVTSVVDSDFAKVNTVEAVQFSSGANSIVLGTAAYNAGIRTVIGGTGNDTITTSGVDAERGSLTIDLTSGGTDTLLIKNADIGNNGTTGSLHGLGGQVYDSNHSNATTLNDTIAYWTNAPASENTGISAVTINGFTAGNGGDKIMYLLGSTDVSVGGYADNVSLTTNNLAGLAVNSVIEIASTFQIPSGGTNLGAVATMLDQLNNVQNGTYYIIIYDGTSANSNAYLYVATATEGDGFDFADNNGAANGYDTDTVELLAVINGVGGDTFTSLNFI